MTLFHFRTIHIVFFVALLIFSSHSLAQNKEIPWNEQGVLAFYKVTGKKLDFKEIITRSDKYKSMPPDAAEQFLHEELLRLQWGTGTFNPGKDFLNIKTNVTTSIIENEGKTYLASNFPGKSALDPPYFPYNLYDVWVALMLKDIEKYMLIEVNDDDVMRIKSFFPDDADKHEVKLEITYKVLSGDPKPLTIDGIEQHMMLGEIAQITMLTPQSISAENRTIWEYVAPWYLDDNEQDLLKILESR